MYDIDEDTWKEVKAHGSKPKVKFFHTATLIPNDRMLILGGMPTDNKGKIYILDLKDFTWTSLNDVSFDRGGHSADKIGHNIYLFGGVL